MSNLSRIRYFYRLKSVERHNLQGKEERKLSIV